MNTQSKKPTIGTIIHVTFRSEDLLPAYAAELSYLAPDHPLLVDGDLVRLLALDGDEWTDDDHEIASELINESLFGALNEMCPDYMYFGNTPGDSSGFGFWPDIERMEEDVLVGELMKVNDLSDVPVDYVGPVMVVNDRGNVTFGVVRNPGEFEEIWSCV